MKTQTIYELLLTAIQDNNFENLQSTIQEILGLPFVICDNNYNVVMQVPQQYYQDELWDSMLKHKTVIPEMVYLIQKDRYQEALDQNDNIIYIDYGIGERIQRIVASIRFEEKVVGYICVLLTDRKVSDDEFERIEILIKFLSLYLSKHIVPHIPNNDMYFHLQDIFANNDIRREDLKNHIIKSITELNGGFVIAYTSVIDKSNEIVYLYQLFNHVNRLDYIHPILDDNHLYLLFTDVKGNDLRSFIQKRLKPILNQTKVVDLSFGISNYFTSIHDILTFKQQAIHAHKFTDNQNYCFFKDIAVEDLFAQVYQYDENNLYLLPALELLKNHDKEYNGNYLYTLEVYVKQLCSSQDTCQILNIHRNSLLYRLDKIQEITSLNLKDKKVITQLLCNFYIYD